MDDQSRLVSAEAAVSALLEPPRRRFFSGRRKGQPPPLPYCENCGAQLHGHWCGQCGQPAIDYRRSFRHVIVDVLDSFLNWDSKFIATVGWLIVRPWRLTNEFLAGHRVRYLHPLRLYLLASILFFFVVNYWAKSFHVDPSKLSPQDRAEVEADLAKENISPAIREKVRDAMRAKTSPQPNPESGQTPVTTATPEVNPIPGEARTPFEKWLETRAKEKLGEHGSNLQLFLKGLINNLPYMVLCCIPLFAFVLKILYVRRGVFYIDHLVYALHIHTFAYVGIMLIGLITIGLNRIAPRSVGGWIVGLLWLWFAIQVLMSIRRVYRQGWLLSIFKFLGGGLAYLIVLCLALAATFLVTLRQD